MVRPERLVLSLVLALLGVGCKGELGSCSCGPLGSPSQGGGRRGAAGADPLLVAVPKPAPSGELEVIYSCGHSMQPFGTAYWDETHRFDLKRAEVRTERVEGDDAEPVGPDGGGQPKRTKSVRVVDAERMERIRRAVEEVLEGGPYRAELPPSEGISCSLSLAVEGHPPFFAIDKASRIEKDEVNQLIETLGVAR